MRNGLTAVAAAVLVELVFGLAQPRAAYAQTSCTPTHTIGAIQGNGSNQLAGGAHDDVSPLNGATVTIEAIAVADFQSLPQPTRSGELRGFFVEEEDDDHDADPTTSEGLFVFTGNAPVAGRRRGSASLRHGTRE